MYSEFQVSAHEAALDLALTAKALFSLRSESVFEPFPSFFLSKPEMRKNNGDLYEIKQAQLEGRDVSTAKKTDKKNKQLSKMIEIFQKLPNPVNLIKDVLSEEQLREKIYSLDKSPDDGKLAYKLLTYVFATNRSTIRLLQPHELVIHHEMIDKQYVLITHDHSKERKFLNNKQKFKSIFCWHGSSLENWYSI